MYIKGELKLITKDNVRYVQSIGEKMMHSNSHIQAVSSIEFLVSEKANQNNHSISEFFYNVDRIVLYLPNLFHFASTISKEISYEFDLKQISQIFIAHEMCHVSDNQLQSRERSISFLIKNIHKKVDVINSIELYEKLVLERETIGWKGVRDFFISPVDERLLLLVIDKCLSSYRNEIRNLKKNLSI